MCSVCDVLYGVVRCAFDGLCCVCGSCKGVCL